MLTVEVTRAGGLPGCGPPRCFYYAPTNLSLSPLSPAFLNVLYIYFSPDINVELSRSPVSTHTHTGELMEESLPLELREQEFKEER